MRYNLIELIFVIACILATSFFIKSNYLNSVQNFNILSNISQEIAFFEQTIDNKNDLKTDFNQKKLENNSITELITDLSSKYNLQITSINFKQNYYKNKIKFSSYQIIIKGDFLGVGFLIKETSECRFAVILNYEVTKDNLDKLKIVLDIDEIDA